jgi:hypothetical protein
LKNKTWQGLKVNNSNNMCWLNQRGDKDMPGLKEY